MHEKSFLKEIKRKYRVILLHLYAALAAIPKKWNSENKMLKPDYGTRARFTPKKWLAERFTLSLFFKDTAD